MGRLSADHLKLILSRCEKPPRVYVETGLYRGEQIAIAASSGCFERVIGIELDPRFAEACRIRVPSAEITRADTRDALPPLARTLEGPVFWCLDAHFCKTSPPITKSPFPLWEELIALRARPRGDVIVIDDVHTFGKKRDDLRFGAAPEWEGVTCDAISSFLDAPGRTMGDGYVVWR